MDRDPASRLARIPGEIVQLTQEKDALSNLLGLYWEHLPPIDPAEIAQRMNAIRARMRNIEDRVKALERERDALIVRAAGLGDRGE